MQSNDQIRKWAVKRAYANAKAREKLLKEYGVEYRQFREWTGLTLSPSKLLAEIEAPIQSDKVLKAFDAYIWMWNEMKKYKAEEIPLDLPELPTRMQQYRPGPKARKRKEEEKDADR